MKDARYSIEVSDEKVLIHGSLTLEELVSIMTVYADLGYIHICPGEQNSTLRITKTLFKRVNMGNFYMEKEYK